MNPSAPLLNTTMSKVIRFPHDASLHARWIGVDLNTTGHAVVAADLLSGKVMKLGKKLQYKKNILDKELHETLPREQALETETDEDPG
jgi:hypothetical protein